MNKIRSWSFRVIVAVMLSLAFSTLADEPRPGVITPLRASDYRTIGLGVAAAFTMAISVLGAAYAVARIGSAAMGAAAEKPELLTRSILFVAIAEGLAVLGFAIAMMLLQKIQG